MFLAHFELWDTYWECVSRHYALFICSLTAALYLWGRKRQTPVLVSGKAFSAFLHKHCPVVAERFSPTPWCWGGRLQTLVCALLKSRPRVTYRNELIRTIDGGQISLDWVDNKANATYPESSTRPTVLILPGLTGNSQQSYVLHAIRQATLRGYRCVVFNNRGVGGEELLTPITYCAANTSDLERVVQHVKGLFPHAPVLGAGVSLGGMLLLNYLSRKRTESGMVAGLTISVPWDAQKSSDSMEEPLNWLLFNKYLTNGLCRAVTRHKKILEKVVDLDHVLKVSLIIIFTSLIVFFSFISHYVWLAPLYLHFFSSLCCRQGRSESSTNASPLCYSVINLAQNIIKMPALTKNSQIQQYPSCVSTLLMTLSLPNMVSIHQPDKEVVLIGQTVFDLFYQMTLISRNMLNKYLTLLNFLFVKGPCTILIINVAFCCIVPELALG
uniref:Abhydrolase domain containing 1 n=1 Tax=Labrus bergylta TaxID=56723 RepID=A0A3Q3F678_9LABR